MMKQVITILFIGLLSFSINAQEKGAQIDFNYTDGGTGTTIDYGTINKGADGIRTFKFKNTGSAPLVISKVNSSCGCTVPKKPDGPIMPGEVGEIQVKYDTKRVMPIRKTITVLSNADTPTVALKIKGEVIDPEKVSAIKKREKSIMEN